MDTQTGELCVGLPVAKDDGSSTLQRRRSTVAVTALPPPEYFSQRLQDFRAACVQHVQRCHREYLSSLGLPAPRGGQWHPQFNPDAVRAVAAPLDSIVNANAQPHAASNAPTAGVRGGASAAGASAAGASAAGAGGGRRVDAGLPLEPSAAGRPRGAQLLRTATPRAIAPSSSSSSSAQGTESRVERLERLRDEAVSLLRSPWRAAGADDEDDEDDHDHDGVQYYHRVSEGRLVARPSVRLRLPRTVTYALEVASAIDLALRGRGNVGAKLWSVVRRDAQLTTRHDVTDGHLAQVVTLLPGAFVVTMRRTGDEAERQTATVHGQWALAVGLPGGGPTGAVPAAAASGPAREGRGAAVAAAAAAAAVAPAPPSPAPANAGVGVGGGSRQGVSTPRRGEHRAPAGNPEDSGNGPAFHDWGRTMDARRRAFQAAALEFVVRRHDEFLGRPSDGPLNDGQPLSTLVDWASGFNVDAVEIPLAPLPTAAAAVATAQAAVAATVPATPSAGPSTAVTETPTATTWSPGRAGHMSGGKTGTPGTSPHKRIPAFLDHPVNPAIGRVLFRSSLDGGDSGGGGGNATSSAATAGRSSAVGGTAVGAPVAVSLKPGTSTAAGLAGLRSDLVQAVMRREAEAAARNEPGAVRARRQQATVATLHMIIGVLKSEFMIKKKTALPLAELVRRVSDSAPHGTFASDGRPHSGTALGRLC